MVEKINNTLASGMVITRHQHGGTTIYDGRLTLKASTRVPTHMADATETRQLVAAEMTKVLTVLLQREVGSIAMGQLPDQPNTAFLGEMITTPEVIDLYQANGIACDQATVSCLARQGRFRAGKLAGSWVFDKHTVLDDIEYLKGLRQQNGQEVQHAKV